MMTRPVRIALLFLLVGLLCGLLGFAQTAPAPSPPAPGVNLPAPPSPVHSMPWWMYVAGIPLINGGLVALRGVAPRIPAKWVPLINLGVGVGLAYTGLGPLAAATGAVGGPDLTSVLMNATVLSGAATMAHNGVKNAVKGDDFGQPSFLGPKPPQ